MIRIGVVLLLLAGLVSCNSYQPPLPSRQRWKEPPRTVTVNIVFNKYDMDSCVQEGGTWVVGQTKDYLDVLVGCIEDDQTK